MANFSALKTAIQNAIRQNGNEEITGDVLQQILLSVVNTMGDGAINTIEQNLSNEATTRQGADTQLNNLITGIKNNIDNGYVYAGIATPSTTPVSGKVFYAALQAGTYTNFGGTAVTEGITILKYNGTSWLKEQVLFTDGGVFDISAYHATGGELAKYVDLTVALGTNGANVPGAIRKGGMSVKFVQSSDNKYVQYRLTADEWSSNTEDWAIADEGVYVDNPEFAEVHTDVKDKVLYGVKTDGDFYFGAGIPSQIQGELDNKVDKEEGKSLINAEYANGVSYIENPEYVKAVTDNNRRFLYGINFNGDFIFSKCPPQIEKYIKNYVKAFIDDYNSDGKVKNSKYTERIEDIKNRQVVLTKYVSPSVEPFIINVANQTDFNAIQDSIDNAIGSGEKNIMVIIQEGIYYSNTSLAFINESRDIISIAIIGIGKVTVYAGGDEYFYDNENTAIEKGFVKIPYSGIFSRNYIYFINEGNDINIYELSRFKYMKNVIRVGTIEEEEGDIIKKATIFIDDTGLDDKTVEECKDIYVQITDTWRTHIYQVYNIQNGSICCTAFNFSRVGNDYSLNNDKHLYNTMPRYRLINGENNALYIKEGHIYANSTIKRIFECHTDTFLSFDNSRFDRLFITGITFKGFTDCVMKFSLNSHLNNINIVGNNFINVNSVLRYACVQSDDNDDYALHFSNNYISNVRRECINAGGAINVGTADEPIYRGCSNIEITNNILENVGYELNNYHAITVRCDNMLISGNKIKNYYGGGGIGIGTWLGNDGTDYPYYEIVTRGIVEYNEIWQDKEHYDNFDQYSLADNGAIYVWTSIQDVAVRFNYIHHCTGIGSNRGIFMDDGAKNISLLGNLILNIDDSFSIDSRIVDRSDIDDANTNNQMFYNILGCPYNFWGRITPNTPDCIKGRNFCIGNFDNAISPTVDNEEDIYMQGSIVFPNGAYINRSTYLSLKNIIDNFILKFIHTF